MPNLRTLVWRDWNASLNFDVVPLAERLFAPGLVSLDISFKGEVEGQRPLFERLSILSPNLETLRWDFGYHSYDPILHVVDALASSVVCLRKIQSLDFFAPMDSDTLKQIILSPNFKELGVMLDHPFSDAEEMVITPTDMPFPNVETIGLDIWNLHFLTHFLRPHQQRFVDVTLEFHPEGRARVQPILSCFIALATPQRMDSVEAFRFLLHANCVQDDKLTRPEELENSPLDYCLTYETLSPLTSFQYLSELEITLHNQISLDDDELVSLARCWPSLQILQLNCRAGGWPWASAKYPTLRGLLALIEACPDLWNLCLPIDARTVPTDVSPDMYDTAIRELEVPDGLISEPYLVAAFLRTHLPSLTALTASTIWEFPLRGGDVEYLERCRCMWEVVGGMLRDRDGDVDMVG